MLVIFDLDDTLIDTSDLFWKVREEFITTLDVKDTSAEFVRQVFEEEDSLSIEKYGFHPERYGKTMMKVYQKFVNLNKIKESETLVNQIKNISSKIITHVPELIDGAILVLETLKKLEYQLVLITRGAVETQQNKIRHHRLRKYFSYVSIVEKKNKNTFLGVIQKLNIHPTHTFIIGDSIRSDINPGLLIGANCIHFQYSHESYHWIQEHGDQPISKEYYEVKKLAQIPTIIKTFELQNKLPRIIHHVKSSQGKFEFAK